MGTETLNSYRNTGIVLTDSGSYNSPFTVTTAGTIQAQAGTDAVSSTAAAPYLLNQGRIAGGAGAYANPDQGGVGGAGGDGVSLNSGTLSNTGNITGGAGGGGYDTGGNGGDGVDLNSGTLSNTGSITGGAGGNSQIAGGSGGAGINVSGAYVYNSGGITGGSGASQGIGAALGINATLVNAGMISGDAGVYASSAANVTNTGTIEAYGFGVELHDGGTVTNSGTIAGGDAGVYVYVGDSASVTNTGDITAADGVLFDAAGTVTNSGTITGGAVGVLFFGGGGGTVTNSGVITGSQAAVAFNGDYTNLLVIDPGAVFNGVVTGGSGLNILEVAGSSRTPLAGIGTEFTGFTQLSFASGAAWTLEGDSAGLNGDTLTGFTKADALDITDLSFVSPEYLTLGASSTLTVTEGGSSDSFTFSGDAGYTFTITSDGGMGTEIEEVTCFAAGTRIATARGEVAVESLEIGDLVRTAHAGLQPVKWIGTRSYAAPFCNHKKVLPVRIRANAIADGIPARDLFVSPGHAICIDGALIHAARLVNGRTITQLERVESVTYYHVELENHEVILAENCPAETFMGEYFRPQFHNAAAFAARYPAASAPEIACLPMLAHGFQLSAIVRRLRARAGMAAPGTPGVLRGYVDAITPSMVYGWAVDASAPDEPVILDILAGSTLIGRVIANIHRPDVAAAGHGAGYHGFELALPAGITERITVRRAADRARLPHPTQQARAA